MNKLRLTLSALACSLILSACGSSNGLSFTPKNVAQSTETNQAKSEAEAKRKADEAEAKRKADEAEAKRKADEAEAKRKADEAEAKRKADEAEAKRKADEAEAKRKAEEAEAKRKADEAEAKRKAEEAEAKRKAEEAEAKRKAEEAEAKANTSLSEAIKSILPVGGNPSRPDNFGTHSYNEFSGSTISINNATGEAKVSANPNANFEDFTINGTQVLLLSRSSDKLKESIPVRALEAADFPAGGFNPKHTDNPGWVGSIGQGGAFGKVRFGVYTDADNVSHLFVHGEPARFMYNAGAYQYEGSAVFGKNGAYQGLGNALTAVADFGSKNIDFTMKVNDSDTLNFGGKISGNTFAGTKNQIETRGGFFGYNDLGGMLNVLDGKYKGYNGTFGATETKALRRD